MGTRTVGAGWDGDRAYGDGVGMGAKSVGMEWGWGHEPRGRLGTRTSSCPRAALYLLRQRSPIIEAFGTLAPIPNSKGNPFIGGV